MDFLMPSIILIASLGAMIYILARKAPELKWIKVQADIKPSKNENKNNSTALEIILQKILSKTRVATIKTESRIAGWLASLRKKSQNQKIKFSENYWDEIKNGKSKEK
jgi:hypothetical protein